MPPSPPPSCAAAAASRRWRCFVNNVHWHLRGLLLSRGSDPPGFQLNHLITPGRGQTIIRIVPEAIVYQDSSLTISSWHTVSNLLLQNINHKSFINIWSVIVETRLCAAELVLFEVFCQSKIEFIRFFYNMNQNYGFKKRKNTENDFPFTTLTYFYKVLLLLFLYLTISTTWGRSFQLSVISHELHRPWKTRTCKRLLYSTTAEWTPSTDEGHSTWLKAPGSKVKTKTLNPQKVWHLFDNPLWKLLLLASVRVKLLFNVTWRVNDEVKWQVSGFKIKQIAVFTLTF